MLEEKYINKKYLDSKNINRLLSRKSNVIIDYVVTAIIKGTYTAFLIKNRFVADYYKDYFDKAWKIGKK